MLDAPEPLEREREARADARIRSLARAMSLKLIGSGVFANARLAAGGSVSHFPLRSALKDHGEALPYADADRR